MDLSDVLLWLGGIALAMVVLQALQGPSRDRGALVARVGGIGLAAWLVYRWQPGYAGYALVLLILMVFVAPRLASRRVVSAFESGRYQRAWCWTYLLQALLPSQAVRESMRLMRAQIRFHLDPDADETVLGAGLTPAQQGFLHLTILVYRCRWGEVGAAIDALPQAYAAQPLIVLFRMRERYECGDLSAIAPLFQLQQQAAAHPAQRQQAEQGRLFLLIICGCVEPASRLALRLGKTQAELAWAQATAQWCAGHEEPARRLLAVLVDAPDPKQRIRAAYRLAHPPTPASALPAQLRQLAAGAVSEIGPRRARTPAVRALFVLNVLMFLLTVGLGMVYSASDPNGRDHDGFEHALIVLGAFLPGQLLQNHQVWRLLTSLFLHGGFLHIGMNMLGLMTIGPAVERRLGWRGFVGLYLLSGLVGNLVFAAVAIVRGHDTILIGASGCIMGIVGAMLYESLADWRAGRQGADRLRFLVLQVVLQCCFDSAHPEVAGAAHLGGLVTGFLLAIPLLPKSPMPSPAAGPSQPAS